MLISEARKAQSSRLGDQPFSHVALGVITYNSAGSIGRLLNAVRPLTNILVADNCSKDSTLSVVRSQAPGAVILTSDVNEGFAKAANRIIRTTSSKYVLLVNPDCSISEDCVLELLRVAEEDGEAAIVAPILRFEDGRLQRSFLPFDPHAPSFGGEKRAMPVRHVIGAVMLLRRDPIAEIGGFDEKFLLYGEDEDLCVRVLAAGYKIVLATHAEAVHTYGDSTKGVAELGKFKAWHLGWSRARFALKSKGLFGLVPRIGKTVARLVIEALVRPRRGNSDRLSQGWYSLRGAFAFVLGRDAHDHVR